MGFILLGFFWTKQIQQNKLSPYRYIILRDGGVVLFARVVSAHCTDGVSFARISLLGWV